MVGIKNQFDLNYFWILKIEVEDDKECFERSIRVRG